MMKKKILIVEDEENVIELLKINLLRRGYQVETAGSGENAIEIAKQWIPDLILLDIMLPGMDGWEVCRKIKEDKSMCGISIIVVSAAAQKTDIQRAKEYSIALFIPKPFDLCGLLIAISELTGVNSGQSPE